MKNRLIKILYFLTTFATVSALIWGADFGLAGKRSLVNSAQAATLNLNGRILLQVQDLGQAWYVNPLNGERYYLGRPIDAFNLMRTFGLGVSNNDLSGFLRNGSPVYLSGRILLQVQDKGQAYYIDPVSLKLFFLGSPTNAFEVIRQKGLGITNVDLARIPLAPNQLSSTPAPTVNPLTVTNTTANFTFKYQTAVYNLSLSLSPTLFTAYQNSPKILTYNANNPPANPRDAFYAMFLQAKANDLTLPDLVTQLQATATANNWTSDQLAEFTLAFVQYIPYDSAKLNTNPDRNLNPYYPYETLYLDRGVCSDKTFLAVSLLRRLGYGAVIMDFPDINHSAVGLQCLVVDSLNGSGYCYAETTNYFPLGVIPQSISGQAQTSVNDFSNLFNSAVLGQIEKYQATTGKIYTGVPALKTRVASLQQSQNDLSARLITLNNKNADLSAQEAAIVAMKAQMDTYYNNGQMSQYNNLVPTYNGLVQQYNTAAAAYQTRVDTYNQAAADFNQAVKDFYQL